MIYQFLKVHRDSCSSTTQHYKGGKTYLRMKKPVFGIFCKPSFTPDHSEWSWMDCIIRCSALWEKLSYRRKSQMKARRLCACVCVRAHQWAVEVSSLVSVSAECRTTGEQATNLNSLCSFLESEGRASKGMKASEYPTEKECIFLLWATDMVCIIK